MKKRFFGLLGAFGIMMISSTAIAQVGEGNIIIDPYYGFPNIGKGFLGASGITEDLSDSFGDVTDIQVTGIGPAGLRVEYMVADNFGVGLDAIYNSAGAKGNYLDSTGTVTYEGRVSMQRLRVQLRFNYHFVQTDNLDVYGGGGAGTNTRWWTASTTQPGVENISDPGQFIKFSLRAAFGMRYYFHPNIGINAEIGIGGPIISGGISLKF